MVKGENTITREIYAQPYDLVVLAVGMEPSAAGAEKPLGLESDDYGFLVPGPDGAEGVLAAGVAAGPLDVSMSVQSATAAALKAQLTLPGIAQTVVLTRTATRSSAMPEGEDLKTLAATGATLAIHLSVSNLARIVEELSPLYGAECPVVVAYRVSRPDQKIIVGTLSDIRERVKAAAITRTALILVGRVLGERNFDDSRLYAADHHHALRPKGK